MVGNSDTARGGGEGQIPEAVDLAPPYGRPRADARGQVSHRCRVRESEEPVVYPTPALAPGLPVSVNHILRLTQNECGMSNHHAYQMYAHITWHTWQRVPCIRIPEAGDVNRAVANSCRDTGVHVLKSAVLSDHVHLVVSFRPDIRLADFVRLAKSRSSTMANRRVFGAVKWARGYYVTTYHRKDLHGLESYVGGQLARHPDRVPRASRYQSD